MNAPSLQSRHLSDLHELAADLEIDGFRKLTRDELIEEVGKRDPDAASKPSKSQKTEKSDRRSEGGGGRSRSGGGRGRGRGDGGGNDGGGAQKQVDGVLEITSRGHGFIRPDGDEKGDDVYVSPSQIRRCELQGGDRVAGPARPPRKGERHPALVHVDEVNGSEPGEEVSGSGFDQLTPVPAHRRLPLDGEGAEGDEEKILLRSIDLLAPLARGHRVLVDATVGSGRTTLVRALARSFAGVNDLEVSVVLVDERPEEEAVWRKQLGEKVELAVAGAEMRSGEQMSVVQKAITKAQRAAAGGADVVVLIDSLSRLGVASDPSKAKPIFAGGRETEEEEGGSLTLIATTIDRDEQRGVAKMLETTENVTITLLPELASEGIYPALDVGGCRTVGEDKLRSESELAGSRKLRAELAALPARDAAARLREKLAAAATNDSLLVSLAE